jgi:hypothetical protein
MFMLIKSLDYFCNVKFEIRNRPSENPWLYYHWYPDTADVTKIQASQELEPPGKVLAVDCLRYSPIICLEETVDCPIVNHQKFHSTRL